MVNEEMDSVTHTYQGELETLARAMTDVNNRLERLYDAIESGNLNLADLAARIRDLQQRQQQLNARRIEIESRMSDRKVELADLETITSYVDDLRDLLNRGSIVERRSFIRSFVKEIVVIGKEATLHYSMLTPPERLVLEKEGVLPTVQYGGPKGTRTTKLLCSV